MRWRCSGAKAMLSLTGSEMRRWMGWFDSGLEVKEEAGWRWEAPTRKGAQARVPAPLDVGLILRWSRPRLMDTTEYGRIDNLTMQHSTCIMWAALAGGNLGSGERKALGAIL